MLWNRDEIKRSTGELRPRSARLLSAVTFGGLIITGLCLSLLYLLDVQSRRNEDKNVVVSAQSAVPTVAPTGAPSRQHGFAPQSAEDNSNTILLHPEDHIHRAPKAIHLSWNITLEHRSPDGVSKPVYLINGQFPGPVIEARPGDQLVVDVYNSIHALDHPGISIHWHGLAMRGANEMDGVEGLTQCAIQAFQNFTYQFRIPDDQAGTFWYHAHSGLQRADGLYGGLIVHKPVDNNQPGDQVMHHYHNEQLLLIGDWYHRRAQDVLEWFVDPDHFGLEPAPDSLLLNGKGRFNCSMAVKARPVECKNVTNPILRLVHDDRIRLRIVNTGVSAGLSMGVSNGAMEVITVDGGYAVSHETASAEAIGILYPGQRIDVVLDRTSENPKFDKTGLLSKLTIELDRENMPLWNFALNRTQSFEMQSFGEKTTQKASNVHTKKSLVDFLNLADVAGQPVPANLGISQDPTQRAVLYSTMKIRAANHNRPVGSINHTSWTPDPKSRPLLSYHREEWADIVPQPTKVHKFDVPWFRASGKDEWVDIVVNNFDDKGHPFHLHGYEFFVVGIAHSSGMYRGYNPFDPQAVSEAEPLNTHNPLRRDTVYIPPMGYVVMRFPLYNDGLWLLHCHVLWHQAIGMGTVLQVGEVKEPTRKKSENTCYRQLRQ